MATDNLPTDARPDPLTVRNRFSGGGVAVVGEDFTDREEERVALARSLRTPKGHLVVGGHRRIGKTSLLLAVRDDLATDGHPVIYVDLWSATTLEDMTTRLATATSLALGTRWTETATTLARSLKLKFEVSETHGIMVPVPTLEFRDASLAAQRQRLVDALDAVEALAAKRDLHVALIMDEFQEIERLGAHRHEHDTVSAMRMVRAAIQHHRHVTYAFAGSDRRLIAKLHERSGGALHNLGRRVEIGPIPPEKFAPWLEQEFARMGIRADGMGQALIAIAGDRTRDVRTLAETCADLARTDPVITTERITAAVAGVVRQRRPMYEEDWKRLTPLQQNVLRAVAAEGTNLTTSAVRQRYSLGESSRVSKTLVTLEERDMLLSDGKWHTFDDPFFRAWVIMAVLPDVGVHLPITYRAGRHADSAADA